MILAAIQHISTSRDCYCLNPGLFIIRIRSSRSDLSQIILHYQDKNIPLSIMDTRKQKDMTVIATDFTHDYWETEIQINVLCLRYWFELIDTKGNTVFYSNYLFSKEPVTDIDEMFDCPQNLREEERFLVPEWAANKIVYQVFPSRFASSKDISPEVWYHSPISFSDDLKGDLSGLISRLDYLCDLGIEIIYLTPIFQSDTCHKYDTIDYYKIDPSFGSKEDLQSLVKEAHSRGIRVILDGVFNHTSRQFFAFQDIEKHGFDSRYIDWYFIEGYPLHADWGKKPNFKSFAYYGGMPKLNVQNPEVTQYIISVALYWLRECGIDGWRLDVADEISHYFWRKFRSELKSEFPDALLIGEIWHYAEDFLQGDEWDTVMNYPFYQSVTRLIADEKIQVSDFAAQLGFLKGNSHRKVYPLLWNLIDSHDTPRMLYQCDGNKAKLKLAASLQMLLPGMPMIYYGDEYAMDGGQDPDCRRGMLWDPMRQDVDMFKWYQALIRVRKTYPSLLGESVSEIIDDGNSILSREFKGNITTIYHCSDGFVTLPEYLGRSDAITGKTFSGTIGPWEAVVLISSTSDKQF